ncbi:MAG: cysteine peptidase family C39 domain-containing protein [Isosphaeraceae bacterium]
MGFEEVRGGIGCRQAVLGVVGLLGLAVSLRGAERGEEVTRDCGVNVLFVLLRLEQRPVSLDRITSALPPQRPDGYSMGELAAAGAHLGLELEGVRFGKGDKTLDRPAIAFFKDARGGHFVVLRPVGSRGTMVQVIDPPRVPWVADYDRLFPAKSWTGRVLVRRDPWLVRNMIPSLMALAGSILIVAGITRRRRPLDVQKSAVVGV